MFGGKKRGTTILFPYGKETNSDDAIARRDTMFVSRQTTPRLPRFARNDNEAVFARFDFGQIVAISKEMEIDCFVLLAMTKGRNGGKSGQHNVLFLRMYHC